MSNCFFKKEVSVNFFKNNSPITLVHRKDLAKKRDFILHLNNHVEIYAYISGDVDYIVEEQYISLKHGDIIIILPNEIHVPVIKSEGEYERIYMLLPLDAFDDFEFNPVLQFASLKNHKISLPDDKKVRFFNLIEQISSMHDNLGTQGQRMIASGLFLEAQGILVNAINSLEDFGEPGISHEVSKQIRDVLNYIGEHAQEIDCVKSIAKHFYISPQYLSSSFKKQVGININEYLRIKKIALAKYLLENKKNIAEIAYECGFSDSSHFIKIFKRYVGMTPKQYRNFLP